MTLPLVLAGPLLRKCSPKAVYVWIALSEDISQGPAVRSLECEVYADRAEGALDELPMLNDQERSARAVGGNYPRDRTAARIPSKAPRGRIHASLHAADHLFIYLLEARPFGPAFGADELLGYEVYLVEQEDHDGNSVGVRYGLCEHLWPPGQQATGPAQRRSPLYQRGYSDDPAGHDTAAGAHPYPWDWRPNPLIRSKGRNEAAYAYPVPTFVLPKEYDIRVWAGSCFKLHGQPPSATLLMYDGKANEGKGGGLLSKHARDPSRRPHLLALMGDQIYADDVAFLAADSVTTLRRRLIKETGHRPNVVRQNLGDLDWLARRKYVGIEADPKMTPFTVDPGVENHLFSLGEYLAYYLLHLNPALWTDPAQSRARVNVHDDSMRHRLDLEHDRLVTNRLAVMHYATVLANVPTYSLCDDHEVTDDWFFDGKWIAAALGKENAPADRGKLAQFIIANAMYAYLAFQALGNAPELFIQREDEHPVVFQPPSEDLPGVALAVLLAQEWSFATPTVPSLLFLDTRTKRSGTGDGVHAPSRGYDFLNWHNRLTDRRNSTQVLLTTQEAIERLIKHAGAMPGEIILVTPSPVLESDAITRKKPFSPEKRDAEGWRENLSNYFMLVEALLKLHVKYCTVLSGDVHYGYHRTAFVRKICSPSQETRTEGVTIEQVVSSPLLNPYERYFGQGVPSFLLGIAKSAFEDEYQGTVRYRASISPKLPLNIWEIRTGAPAAGGSFHPCFTEQTTHIDLKVAGRAGQVVPMLQDSHFVELAIGQGRVKPTFHGQERDGKSVLPRQAPWPHGPRGRPR